MQIKVPFISATHMDAQPILLMAALEETKTTACVTETITHTHTHTHTTYAAQTLSKTAFMRTSE